MSKILCLAWVTVREALRQKLAVNLLVFAVLLIAASITISTVTFGEQYRIISDVALTSAQVFGTVIAVFLGAGLVSGDVQRRTIYPIIAKPIERSQYLAGRYVGLVATVSLNLLVMVSATAVVLAIYTGGFAFLATTPFIPAAATMGAQFAIVAAIAVAFSSITNTTLAAILALSFTIAGHFSRSMFAYWTSRGSPVRMLAYVVPNLAALDFKVQVVYQSRVHAAEIGWCLAYAVLYVATVLTIASLAFVRRDFR